MGSKIKTNYIAVLMITALLSAVIAPACQAVWGNSQTLLEVCTAQGIKTIALSSGDTAPNNKKSSMPTCDFCFQNTHIHFADIETLTLLQTIPTLQRYKVIAEDAQYTDERAFPYEAHAPPLKS